THCELNQPAKTNCGIPDDTRRAEEPFDSGQRSFLPDGMRLGGMIIPQYPPAFLP
uniref:Uncharacterized protein n=1 Tax=Anopheles atroparvus TaxID=41427 RepID=A0AAG5DWI7_ANOAO